MKKILFVLMAAAILVSCNINDRRVPYRLKDCVTKEIEVINLDSGFRVNDTVILQGYAYKYVILERVK